MYASQAWLLVHLWAQSSEPDVAIGVSTSAPKSVFVNCLYLASKSEMMRFTLSVHI
jgi:hypothetical protein